MRVAIVVAVFVWLLSGLYLLINFDVTPDSFGESLAGAIFVVGLIAGLAGVVIVAVAAIREGQREKKMWSE
ncbi:MAG TPA: hypothetical protein VFL41_01285 [Gaiellaceae bacterium]|nr:hypothetical protein [Gaiellaceae bacterium]